MLLKLTVDENPCGTSRLLENPRQQWHNSVRGRIAVDSGSVKFFWAFHGAGAASFGQIPAVPKLLLPLTLLPRSHRHSPNLTGDCVSAK